MKFLFPLFNISLFALFSLQAQNTQISGQIISEGELEGIHVINRTAFRYATTDKNGFFIVEGKESDSLYFSSIQHQPKTVVLTKSEIKSRTLTVTLLESLNELDEVVLGAILTGDLNSDIGNSEAKRPLDFYDLGIPGYTGPRMNLVERRLFEADSGPLIPFRIPPSINFYKLLNMMTGRTKMLKEHVKLDADKQSIRYLRDVVGPLFFINHDLAKDMRMEFYYFCSDDIDFQDRCVNRSDVEVLEYLDEKLIKFKTVQLSEN
ncbi:carboxypeptidase-like regulatory domain-containing protein [Flavobacteriaceae bacterium]|nr:carboxypeptidase-like regulatory domain-containing protein [Flavobacteriaceae bacterium]